ncbi:YbaB/EbfC family nucleoid-associated protein [Nocardioides sp. zg-1228]|uniref:YbaB/EbfC family nucleoid-associated protein n=1 Tax=Nocardioides sp. zg-1228 TaxID=2763008 RepID=UPI0016434FB6|nr:YbaB/EbfC family nucleoid-associated protein [Nocardioides sp. zg-1228]MBC2932206.1 YbaB/EbfC family nucleoid-associated protein [Nocardioides sp. zg-1228]QSF57738.1 YbaB/EbfC family nucleoid-associated protein [Nocardioides sp. zg-1228]
MSSRLDAYLAAMNESFDAAEARLDQAQALAATTERMRVEGESTDRVVTVVVDGNGQMVDLRFDDSFAGQEPARLAHSVLEAHSQAKRRLSFEVEQAAREIYGPDVAAASTITQSYRNTFGYEEYQR